MNMRSLTVILTLAGALTSCGKNDGGTSPSHRFDPPSQVSASRVGRTSVRIAWKDNSDYEESFWIDRRANAGDFVPRLFAVANDTSVVDSLGLSIDSVYQYRVYPMFYKDDIARKYSDTATITLTLPYPTVR